MNHDKHNAPAIGRLPATLLGLGLSTLLVVPAAQAEDGLDISIGGYVKADLIYDLDQDRGDTNDAGGIDVNADSQAHFRAHAKQSRFHISATEGDFKAFVQADFFTGESSELVSNSRGLRLRHAYGKKGPLLVGQTWSNFMDFTAYPTTVDFDGPTGAVFARQTQIRYDLGNVSVALENPESRVAGTGFSETIPDITARFAHQGGAVDWYVAGLLQQFEADGGPADGETANNVGVHVGAKFKFGQSDIMGFAVVNGSRYAYQGFAQPLAVVSGGDVEPIEQVAWGVAYNHATGNGGNFTASYSMLTFDDEFANALGQDSPEEIGSAHINYRWKADKRTTYMVEVSNVSRENFNGQDGDNTRLQFAAQYSF